MIDNNFQNKVALVTGASSGLGEHFAKTLANAECKVIVAARRRERLEELVESIQSAGGEAHAVAMDVTDKGSVIDAIDEAESTFGPITILVNNAGVADSKRFVNVDEESWDFVMNANLKGAWCVANEISQRLLTKQLRGSIVNIASILGLRQAIGESTYAISKAGVIQMTKSMALELANKNVRVNALCPGYFKTELNASFFESSKGKSYIENTPARRLGQLQELDGPLLLLCGESGSFINGEALAVDGGHLVNSL
jgi:NAD(P)-dependent dehydrogenase (short-subunit alcohol dehydrogenase family)